ncbi:MAG: 50S ribosomal protein L10 [bacterium]|nr:50S ribosomal protein L10 [bacterium]
MAITKAKKVDILSRLQNEVVKAKTIVFVNFHGLPVAESAKLRRSLREQAVKFFVAKKTLIKKALTEAGLTGEMPSLDGEIALAYGDDQLVVSKGVYEYERKTNGLVKILGGVLDGTYANQQLMLTLAQIPPREILLGQFLNLINSPLQGLAMALNEIAKKKA